MCTRAGRWPVQLRFATGLTSESYVSRQAWREASLPCCPLHPKGGCGWARHGTYVRVQPAGTDTAFRSLLDLPAILAAVMGRGALPAVRPSQLLVGWSERWVYGQIWPDGSHLFVDDATGTVTARRGAADAMSVRSAFQAMLDAFGTELGPRSK